MRRELVLGLAAVAVVVGVGVAAVLWLVETVRDKDDGLVHRTAAVQAVFVAADDRTLTAEATLPFCGKAKLDVDESGDTIALTAEVAIDPTTVCQLSIGDQDVTATLNAPVGDREIVSGATPVPRLDAADLPAVGPVPSGFRATSADQLLSLGDVRFVVSTYADGPATVTVRRSRQPVEAPDASSAPIRIGSRTARQSTPAADAAVVTFEVGKAYVQVAASGRADAVTIARRFAAAVH